MTDEERAFWINFLRALASGERRVFTGADPPLPLKLPPFPELKLLGELANILEEERHPKRSGRRSRSQWTSYEIMIRNCSASSYRSWVAAEVNGMKERGERPRGGRRNIAEAIVAERLGISVRMLQKKMRPLPNRSLQK